MERKVNFENFINERIIDPIIPLLSLVPPSCMVAPIRDLGNKFFSSFSNIHSQQAFDLPTVSSSINIRMDIPPRNILDNYNKMRGRTSLPKTQYSRASSLSSTKFSVAYYKRMKLNNAMNIDIKIENDSPQLSYEIFQKKVIWISMVANLNRNTLNKHIMIKCPASSPSHTPIEHPTSCYPCADDTDINIQLLYDPNSLIELNLWDGNFYPISLHNSIEYLALDSKNIKDLLNFMAKYINNKQVNPARANDLKWYWRGYLESYLLYLSV